MVSLALASRWCPSWIPPHSQSKDIGISESTRRHYLGLEFVPPVKWKPEDVQHSDSTSFGYQRPVTSFFAFSEPLFFTFYCDIKPRLLLGESIVVSYKQACLRMYIPQSTDHRQVQQCLIKIPHVNVNIIKQQ